jgi:hypothetical protein
MQVFLPAMSFCCLTPARTIGNGRWLICGNSEQLQCIVVRGKSKLLIHGSTFWASSYRLSCSDLVTSWLLFTSSRGHTSTWVIRSYVDLLVGCMTYLYGSQFSAGRGISSGAAGICPQPLILHISTEFHGKWSCKTEWQHTAAVVRRCTWCQTTFQWHNHSPTWPNCSRSWCPAAKHVSSSSRRSKDRIIYN